MLFGVVGEELYERVVREIYLLAGEHILAGDDAPAQLVLAEEQHERNLELVRVAHFRLEFLLLGVELRFESGGAKLCRA